MHRDCGARIYYLGAGRLGGWVSHVVLHHSWYTLQVRMYRQNGVFSRSPQHDTWLPEVKLVPNFTTQPTVHLSNPLRPGWVSLSGHGRSAFLISPSSQSASTPPNSQLKDCVNVLKMKHSLQVIKASSSLLILTNTTTRFTMQISLHNEHPLFRSKMCNIQ